MPVGEGQTSYKSVANLVTASDLQKKLEALEQGRSAFDRQWKMNLAFYRGKQYAYYPASSQQLLTLPVDEGEMPRWKVRLVSNQILVGAQSLLSKYIKTKPVMYATPESGAEQDVKASQLAERLLEYWWEDMHLDEKLEEALVWSIICGQGYWKLSWDPQAGKDMRFMLDPNGQPILDDSIKDAFRGQLEKIGVKPMEKVVYLGDLRVDVPSPFHVYFDPSANAWTDAKYMICKHFLDPDEIYARWNVRMDPDSVSMSPDEWLPLLGAEASPNRTVSEINIGYFLPTPAIPNGRYVVWAKKSGETLEDGPWPYPFTQLPIIKFPGIRIPGCAYDSSAVEQAIPLQKELNKTLSQIVEYKNMTVRPRVWAPVNSIRGRMTTEPGVVNYYNPINGQKPEFEQLPTMPSYVFDHVQDISNRLREMFGITEITEGTPPPNVEAGIAIDLLQEMATDRIAPTVRLIEMSLERAGNLMLRFAQQYYIEPRLLKIRGSGGSFQVKRFSQADLGSGVSIRVEAGSGLPRTRAGRVARIMQYMDMGIIAPEEAWKHADSADLKSVSAKWMTDEDLAYREHEKILKGIPLNPEAIKEAEQFVDQGINPETGEPITILPDGSPDPSEVQTILMRAALKPGVADIHPVHIDVHGRFLKSIEFENLPPEIRLAFIWHYEMTIEAARSLPQPEPQAPRVNLQLKSTIGPTAQSKVLQQAGVPVSPEESAEPPLETWVSDDVDEPDTDAAGPGQEAESLSKVAKELLAATIAEKKAKQESSQSQEMHHQSVRRARAEADTAEKKARQSDFSPKKPENKAA